MEGSSFSYKCLENSHVDGAGTGGSRLAGGAIEDLAGYDGLLAREASVEDVKVTDDAKPAP